MSSRTKYLISAECLDSAHEFARQCQIPRDQWKYVSWPTGDYPIDFFRQRLRGLVGFERDHLIGWFSDAEIADLTRKV